MGSLGRLAVICRSLAKQHVDDPDVPAAPDGADGYAKWTQIALILFRIELGESLPETDDYLNEMPGILAVFDLDETPHYNSFYRWEDEYRIRELRRLFRATRSNARQTHILNRSNDLLSVVKSGISPSSRLSTSGSAVIYSSRFSRFTEAIALFTPKTVDDDVPLADEAAAGGFARLLSQRLFSQMPTVFGGVKGIDFHRSESTSSGSSF